MTRPSSAPTAEDQLVFLAKLQRVFAEGDFTATYKFALLVAIAELAVESGFHDVEPLVLRNDVIAGKFIEMYWQQAAPYSASGAAPRVLIQNNGTQAAVITAIVEFRRRHAAATLQSAHLQLTWRRLLRQVATTVSAQPIKYLQNLGGATDPFLYQRVQGGIVLKRGVAYCLRRFQPLIQQLSRSHWLGHVKRNRLNLAVVGDAEGLESFLFEASRQSLAIAGKGLRSLTGKKCFYCGSGLDSADVDHFVPFALYPRDVMHNFVLAHPACNRSKSDTLAARSHLERWLDHIDAHDDDLREIGESAGLIVDAGASHAVAEWAYENAVASGGRAWKRAKSYESVGIEYLASFQGADSA